MPASLTAEERSALAGFRRQLEDTFGAKLLDVRLFGSRARGDAEPDSDYDVLVLLDVDRIRPAVHEAVVEAACRILEGQGLYIAPLLMDKPRWDFLRGRERRIVRDVEEEGVPL